MTRALPESFAHDLVIPAPVLGGEGHCQRPVFDREGQGLAAFAGLVRAYASNLPAPATFKVKRPLDPLLQKGKRPGPSGRSGWRMKIWSVFSSLAAVNHHDAG
jgi:hypothetical protein